MPPEVLERLRRTATRGHRGGRTTELLQQASELVGSELGQVKRQVRTLVSRPPSSTSAAARQLVDGGGKAVRPLLVLLAAEAVGGHPPGAVPHAVAAELVHSATLLHDDVIDDGQVRRGRPAARVIWGNTISVLSGDLLFVQALQLVEQAGPPVLLRELMQTVSAMVEGEVLQHEQRGRFTSDEALYEAIVDRKTASLFRWCARAGAMVGEGTTSAVDALGAFGAHLGRAFQVRDDVLDLTGSSHLLGKDLARDLEEGKLTLPAIHAVGCSPALLDELQAIARAGSSADPERVRHAAVEIRQAGGVEYARRQVEHELQHAQDALESVPPGPARSILGTMAAALAIRDN